MIRDSKSNLLSILGVGAILGGSLFSNGCKKEEVINASQVSQSIWDKLDGENIQTNEFSKIEKKQSSSTFLKSQVVLDSYREGAAFTREEIKVNRPKINILGYPFSMSFYAAKFGNDPVGSSCCINFCKSESDIPVEIDYSQSQSYIVFSRPIIGFKKAPTSKGPLISFNKLEDKKLTERLISTALKEPKFGNRFDFKKSEVYAISLKENEKYHSSMQFCGPDISSFENGLQGFVQFTQSNEFLLEGVCTALICDFKFENKEQGVSADVTGCVTMPLVPPIFPEATGCWMKNSDRTIIEMVPGHFKIYTRNSSALYSSELLNGAEYDKRKDIIYLEGNNLPAIGREKVSGGIYLYFIDQNGRKESMGRTSLR